MVPSVFIFQFSIKKRQYSFDRFANISYFFFSFLMKVHAFLTIHNFERSLRSKNFLSTILDMVPLFFQRIPFFWRNCLMQSFSVQLSLLSFPFPYVFLPSFLFISLTSKHDISFKIQLIKKSVLRILKNRVWSWYEWGVKFMFYTIQ